MAKKQTESKTMDNQTLEKLKRIYNQADSFGKELMEKEFPELKESEDERVRKALLSEFISLQSKGYKFAGLEGEDIINWLEKQGEQKPADKVEPKFKVGDTIINKYFRWDDNRRIREITDDKYIFDDGSYINIKEQDEWKLDEWILCLEVKPKFKVGDWVVRNYTNHDKIVNKVINVKQIDETYGYKLDDGSYFSGSFEKEYRLWSIEDAEKGDILQANKCTLIFDSLTKDIDGNTVISSWYYCNTKAFYGMGQSEPDLWDIEGIIPATKEQCYFLFQKMKEAGYVWNANKKELKKINDETNQ